MLVYQYLLNIMEEHIKFENVKITQHDLPKCISCILMTSMEQHIFWIIMYYRGRRWKAIQILDTSFITLGQTHS